MTTDEIIKLIKEIPAYISYLYPGYILMFIFYYFQALTLDETKAKLMKSFFVSYCYISLTKYCIIPIADKILKFPLQNDIGAFGFNTILTMLAFIVPYSVYLLIFKSGILSKVLKALGISTVLYRNEIEAVTEGSTKSPWISVYLKNSNIMYEGFLTQKELESNRIKFFCLTQYRKYEIQSKKRKIKVMDFTQDKKEKVLIYLEQISHFEVRNMEER
ncbi:MAG: hypothetical protein HFG28_04880 [Eubacterium sp.]|nr:hypothetical protein [Eubacterium sp.]